LFLEARLKIQREDYSFIAGASARAGAIRKTGGLPDADS
jgi:hypothetical protein